MNLEVLLAYFFYTGLIIVGIGIAMIAVGVSIFDVRKELRQRRMRLLLDNGESGGSSITIIMYVDGNVQNMSESLASIEANQYSNYDVVVVDNMNSVNIRREVAGVVKLNSHLPIYFYKNRRHVSMTAACKEGYRRSKRGNTILIMTPGMQLSPDALHMATEEVAEDTYGLLSLVYGGYISFESIYLQLKAAAQDALLKVTSIYSRYDVSVLQIGAIYPKVLFTTDKTRRVRRKYLSTSKLLVNTSDMWSYIRLRESWYVRTVRYIALVVLVVAVWQAATTDESSALLFIWSMSIVWAIVSLCQCRHMSIRTKLHIFAAVGTVMYVRAANSFVQTMLLVLKRSTK